MESCYGVTYLCSIFLLHNKNNPLYNHTLFDNPPFDNDKLNKMIWDIIKYILIDL